MIKVVKAAIRNSWRRNKPAAGISGYNGPVNLPDGIAAAMRKTHSYMWLDNAVKQEEQVGGGEYFYIVGISSRRPSLANWGLGAWVPHPPACSLRCPPACCCSHGCRQHSAPRSDCFPWSIILGGSMLCGSMLHLHHFWSPQAWW